MNQASCRSSPDGPASAPDFLRQEVRICGFTFSDMILEHRKYGPDCTGRIGGPRILEFIRDALDEIVLRSHSVWPDLV